MSIRLHAPAALLALALLIGGCGEDESPTSNGGGEGSTQAGAGSLQEFGANAGSSAASQAKSTLRDYFDARASEDWAEACSYMPTDVRRLYGQLARQDDQVPGDTCAAFAKSATERRTESGQPDPSKVQLGAVRVAGRSGFVLYSGGGTELAMPIKKEEGTWKPASLVGVPAER